MLARRKDEMFKSRASSPPKRRAVDDSELQGPSPMRTNPRSSEPPTISLLIESPTSDQDNLMDSEMKSNDNYADEPVVVSKREVRTVQSWSVRDKAVDGAVSPGRFQDFMRSVSSLNMIPTITENVAEEEKENIETTNENYDYVPDVGIICNVGLFNNPLCFIGIEYTEEELLKGLLLTGKMDDTQFRKLIAMNVTQYMTMLNLSPNEKRNSEMLSAWLFAGCNNWIRVAGNNNIPTVKLTRDDTVTINEFTAEFEKDENGKYCHEEALFKATVDNKISEQDYLDWYVICRYYEAIIPPVVSGCPIFESTNSSFLSAVLSDKPELYEQLTGRQVRTYSTC